MNDHWTHNDGLDVDGRYTAQEIRAAALEPAALIASRLSFADTAGDIALDLSLRFEGYIARGDVLSPRKQAEIGERVLADLRSTQTGTGAASATVPPVGESVADPADAPAPVPLPKSLDDPYVHRATLIEQVLDLRATAADVEASGLGEWDEGYRDATSDVLGLLNAASSDPDATAPAGGCEDCATVNPYSLQAVMRRLSHLEAIVTPIPKVLSDTCDDCFNETVGGVTGGGVTRSWCEIHRPVTGYDMTEAAAPSTLSPGSIGEPILGTEFTQPEYMPLVDDIARRISLVNSGSTNSAGTWRNEAQAAIDVLNERVGTLTPWLRKNVRGDVAAMYTRDDVLTLLNGAS